MKKLLLILFFILPLTCFAEIYKSVDANGNVTYTDKQTNSNQVQVVLPASNTVSSPSTVNNTNTGNVPSPGSANPATPVNAVPVIVTVTKANKPYTKFEIISPANEETIQNQPTIPIKINVEPALQPGDVIQIYLDGSPWGNPLHNTQFQFTAPDRGTHVISATLFDNSMGVLKQSNSNTIYVHHTHL